MPQSRLYSIPYLDKLVHICMYGSLGLVVLYERHCLLRCFPKEIFLLFLIFTLSTLMEVLQATVVASRGAEWFDLVANSIGLAGAWLSYSFFRRFIS